MDINDKDFLTQLLQTFQTACTQGAENIMPHVLALTFALGVIKMAYEAIMNQDQDQIKALAVRFLQIGFFVWLVQNWVTGLNLSGLLFSSFQKIGIIAALGSDRAAFLDPSAIGNEGQRIIKETLISLSDTGLMGKDGVLGMLGVILLKIILMIVIVLCVFFMAIQLFLTTVKYYIFSMLGMVMLPWGLNKNTRNFAESAIAAAFTLGIQMMVLQFIMCLSVPMMRTWTAIPKDGTPASMMNPLLGCMALAFITWQAPNVAASLLSGSPSLSAGSAIGAAGSVVGTAAGAASGATRVAGMAYQATRATGGASPTKMQTAKNLGTMALQSTPFFQGRQQAKSLLQNASQIKSNNTDFDAFKAPKE